MKILLAPLLVALLIPSSIWLTDFNQAKVKAKANNQLILINFSGSDWCGPCIRTKKELFTNEVFQNYANDNLILVNADFPRMKKNLLSKDQVKKNEALAEIYNQEGAFPLTLLVSAEGKVLKQWKGFPNESPAKFIEEIMVIGNATN